jgi:signal transduction histidine kinase
VTDRERAETDLRFKTALLEAQVNCSHDGLLVVDHQGKKILQNQRLVDLWKIPRHIADDVDDSVQVRFVTQRTRNPEQFVAKVLYLYSHPNETSFDEIELIDGTVLDRHSNPIVGADGTYYGRIWSFRDITARKQLEEQLRQAQKMEAVGRLAGGIAHEFNNQLGVITGHGDLLVGEMDADDPRRRRLEQIGRAANRLVALTRQLMAFGRQQVLQPRRLDLNAELSEIEPMLKSLLGEGIQLAITFGPDLGSILADQSQIEQVIMNLAANAREAMPRGGRLALETANVDLDAEYASHHPGLRPGPYVMLAVSDSGVGMDEEARGHLFEPFFTTKAVGKGPGLGLAMVHGIVSQSDGYIQVRSEPEKGTTFQVYLPRVEKEAVASKGAPSPPHRGGLETILVVEDEPALMELDSEVLKERGYRVLEADCAAQALEVAAGHPGRIDLLLTDVVMPGQSGGELARRLVSTRPETKVLYMSGYASDSLVQHGISEEAAAFIEKPFAPDALVRKVRAVLDS